MSKPATPDARSFALEVVRRLRDAGHEALWAGGCVRDLLLGHIPKDFDVATSARPEDVQALFRRTIAIGASFGVINVLGGRGLSVEVATFRSDLAYVDGRHPEGVVYSTPQEDAQRRDFTINGMFFDPVAETVIDYVDGERDLARRVIRAIGVPEERFGEDKLRMLRAVRFAARFGFVIDEPTHRAIAKLAPDIDQISAERILAEIRFILEPISRVRGFELLVDSTLARHVLWELDQEWARPQSLAKTLAVLGHWNWPVSLPLAIAGLFTAMEDHLAPPAGTSLMNRLRSSNGERDRTAWLLAHRRSLDRPQTLPTHRIKRILAEPGREELLDLKEATDHADAGASADVEWLRRQLSEWGDAGVDPLLLLTGDDLIAMGYRPGRRFKEILDAVRDAQLDGGLTTRDECVAFVQARWPLEG